MNTFWRALLKTLASRLSGGIRDSRIQTLAPDTIDAGGAKRPASMVPPGIFDRRPIIKRNTPHGIFCLPGDFASDVTARAIAEGAPVAADVLELLKRYVVKDSVVIDVGAGLGQMTALFSGLTGPAGQVLAFEADEYLCDVLQHTIRFNLCENVRVFFGAVYDGSRATVTFPSMPVAADAVYSGQRIDPAARKGASTHTLTIDSLQIQAPVSLMFVDTNGCELQVLRGAKDTIARLRMPIALKFDPALAAQFGSTMDDLMKFLDAIGYSIIDRHGGQLCIAAPQNLPAADGKPHDESRAIETARPNIVTPPFASTLCKLLQSRTEVDACTLYLKKSGYVPHNVECKNWDLAHIIPAIGDGNFLDMGSSHSYILKNLALKRIRGELVGIDLRAPDVPVGGVKYLTGDLMHTPLPDGHFTNITCLSVLEHEVDYDKFAAEASRLLAPGGRVFVTFDYWEPRVTPPIKLYQLDWMLLDADRVRRFIASCAQHGLDIVGEFDFNAGDPLICRDYFSPHPEVSYTFGIAAFQKR